MGSKGNVLDLCKSDLITQYQGILPGYNEYYLTISSLPLTSIKMGTEKNLERGLGSTII